MGLKSHLHELIWTYRFINFEGIFPLTCLFNPTWLFILVKNFHHAYTIHCYKRIRAILQHKRLIVVYYNMFLHYTNIFLSICLMILDMYHIKWTCQLAHHCPWCLGLSSLKNESTVKGAVLKNCPLYNISSLLKALAGGISSYG